MSEEDKKQLIDAIRELLLSDEFMKAFAKAFVETPLPSTIVACNPYKPE